MGVNEACYHELVRDFFYINLFVVYMAGCLMEGNQGHVKTKFGAN